MSESKVQHISATRAYELIQEEPATAFIDVRSDMEYLFIGHPIGAVNIPWIDEPDYVINPDFEREVRKLILGGIEDATFHTEEDGEGFSLELQVPRITPTIRDILNNMGRVEEKQEQGKGVERER